MLPPIDMGRRDVPPGLSRPNSTARLCVEQLEHRLVPSLGPAIQVSTPTEGSAVASGPGGTSVVAWLQETAHLAQIRAQLFNSAGQPIGKQILVARDADPQAPGGGDTFDTPVVVAMNAHGDFVVAWDSFPGPAVRVYSAQGQPRTREIAVPVQPKMLGMDQNYSSPAIALEPDGRFVVAYVSDALYADMFSAAGKDMRNFRVTGNLGLQASSPGPDAGLGFVAPSSIAATPHGGFAIAYSNEIDLSAQKSLVVKYYSAAGKLLHTTAIAHPSRQDFQGEADQQLTIDPGAGPAGLSALPGQPRGRHQRADSAGRDAQPGRTGGSGPGHRETVYRFGLCHRPGAARQPGLRHWLAAPAVHAHAVASGRVFPWHRSNDRSRRDRGGPRRGRAADNRPRRRHPGADARRRVGTVPGQLRRARPDGAITDRHHPRGAARLKAREIALAPRRPIETRSAAPTGPPG